MKIHVISDTYAPDVNGVAMTLGRWCAGLRRLGHRVYVTHTSQGSDIGEDERVVASVPLLGYEGVRLGMPQWFSFKRQWGVDRPDVVYVATQGPLGYSAIHVANQLSIPVVAGFHTYFQDYMAKYRVGGLAPYASAYLKKVHQGADCTLVPSMDVRARLVELGYDHVKVVGRGVDAKLFTPSVRCDRLRQSWGCGAHALVALIVGRVASEKNFELGIQAFEEMRRMLPDVVCVVVGDGPIRQALEKKYSWVRFVGFQSGHDLARYYASSDILVFPSETETFGNVVLEGMASGLSVVAYDYGAAGHHIEDQVNGFKVAKGDFNAFLSKSIEALDVERVGQLRSLARAKAESLSWDRIVSDLEANFAEVVMRGKMNFRLKDLTMKTSKKVKRGKLKCKTVILSDLHLGTVDSKAEEVVDFLKSVRCDELILNGDIVDGWALKRGSRWLPTHSRVIRQLLKMTERHQTNIHYLRGNHDEVMERFMPFVFGRISFKKEMIYTTQKGKRYLVIHGDGFDSVSTNHRWLASLGSVGYDFLLWVNRFYNYWRAWRGKEYFSISKKIKSAVKSAVCFVDRYEELLQNLAAHRKCDGIICGHIHTPEDKMVGGVHYLNSGDWVESLTAIIETVDGELRLIRYDQMDSLISDPMEDFPLEYACRQESDESD